jgi:hypothetical protein
MTEPEVIYRELVYAPLPSQHKFHTSTAKFKAFSGPVGCGKSKALAFEILRLAEVNAGRLGLIGAPTYPMLRDATLTTLFAILDENEFPYDYNKVEGVLVFPDWGTKILCRSLETVDRLRGTTLAFFGVDEAAYTPEAAWYVLQGRLRCPFAKQLCGFAVTSPNGFNWFYNRFVAEPKPDSEIVYSAPFENKHLPAEYYESLKAHYDSKLYEQDVLGKYLDLAAGRAYHAFAEQNLAPVEFNPHFRLEVALDFNVDPMSAVLAQFVSPAIHVLDEISLRNSNTFAMCAELWQRLQSYIQSAPAPLTIGIYGDASGTSRKTSASQSDYDIIRSFFKDRAEVKLSWNTNSSNPLVRDRVNAVNGMLCNAEGERRLLIHPRCKELTEDLRRVGWKAGSSTELDKSKDPHRTHMSDALGYFIWRDHRPDGFQRKRIGVNGEYF